MRFALIKKTTCVLVAGKCFYPLNFSKLLAENSNKTPALTRERMKPVITYLLYIFFNCSLFELRLIINFQVAPKRAFW